MITILFSWKSILRPRERRFPSAECTSETKQTKTRSLMTWPVSKILISAPEIRLSKIDMIEEAIKKTMDKHVPSKLTSSRYSLPWFGRDQWRLCRKKQRRYNKAKRTNNPKNWRDYSDVSRELKKNLRHARNNYINSNLSEAFKENPKKFWSFMKIRQEEVGIPDLKVKNKIVSDSKQKAEAFNHQFVSVFTAEEKSEIPDLGASQFPDMPHIEVTETGVLKLLQNLDPNEAPGPDKIPPWFLKMAAPALAQAVLTDIFQDSIDQGITPRQWREANITPIYKKGDKSQPVNYRPVSLTSVINKMIEHIIHSQIMQHSDQHNILTSKQHGFRAQHSTESQLILTIHDITSALEEGKIVQLAILDFAKAFDKVPHERLLNKMQYCGIRGSLLSWMRDFLTNRKQRVVIEGISSADRPVISSVPQGTVIGPLGFLIFINDLPWRVQNSVRLFADDCVLYTQGDTEEDLLKLQVKILIVWKIGRIRGKWSSTQINARLCKLPTRERPTKTKVQLLWWDPRGSKQSSLPWCRTRWQHEMVYSHQPNHCKSK